MQRVSALILFLGVVGAQPPPECNEYRQFSSLSHVIARIGSELEKRFVTDMTCYERPLFSGDFYCFYNGMTSIPHLPARTQCIIFTGNRLDTLDASDISHLTSLEILILDSNPLMSITGDFSHIPLKVLSLEQTNLPSLPPVSFPSLEYYSQTSTNIGKLSNSALKKISTKLQFLKLYGAGIKEADDNTFESLNLNVLILSNNNLTTVPRNLPRTLQRLEMLGNLDIHVLRQDDFPPLPDIQNISVSAQTITTNAFINVQNVRQLKLEACVYKSNVTKQLNKVNSLDILPPFCEDGKLYFQPYAFAEMTSLTTFTMRRSVHLSTLPSGLFAGADNLDSLYIEFDNVDEVQTNAFEGIPNVSRFRLTNNYIPVQQSVNFSSQLLGSEIKSKLTLLDLSDFRIAQLDDGAFDTAPNLERLYMGYNKMTTLTPGVIENLKSLQYLSVYENPWICDCHLRWLKNLTSTRPDIFYELGMVKCDQPDKLHGQLFTDLTVNDFVC